MALKASGFLLPSPGSAPWVSGSLEAPLRQSCLSAVACPLEEGEEKEGRLSQMRILSEGGGTFFEVWWG